MGLGFLVPAFLAGILAIAIPVVVHLLNKERKEVVRFPSLMFLERIPYRAIRRQTIRHPLLLALRALAVLLLVAAFARPFLERKDVLTAALGGTETVILLDRSYSMGYGDRWARAVEAVRAETGSAAPGDHVTLIAFDERATSLHRPAGEGSQIPSALDSLRPGHRTTRLGPALAAAREIFAGSTLPLKQLVLVSDLQRSAWEGGTEGRIPANVEARIVSVADSAIGNAMVVTVDIDREERGGQNVGSVVARIRNQEARDVRRTATLRLQGRDLESRPVALPPLGLATVRFTPVPVPPNPSEGTVSLDNDALPADDVFHFSLSRDQSLPVLVLSRAGPSRSIYLRRALELGRTPPFELTLRTPDAVTPATLDRYAVVVLNNLGFPSGAVGDRLAALVRQGTGLVVVAGEGTDPARWNPVGAALLPVGGGTVVDRTGERGGRISSFERSHRVFQPFARPKSGDFTSAHFLRYRALVPNDSARALAWYDDGNVALAEGSAGRGRVLVWGSTLDDYWNDLVLQPVFLPFLHAMVRYAAGYTPDPAWRTVGQQLAFEEGSDSSRASEVLVAPGGERHRFEPDQRRLELVEPGFYQIQTERRETSRLIAVNVDRKESDLAAWNPDELKAAITSRDSLSQATLAEATTEVQLEERQRVWWFLLAGAALLLVIEVVLANRLSRARPAYDGSSQTMTAGG